MTSHDACTSGTSRVLTVASSASNETGWSYSSSRRLWSAECDKFLNAQSIVPIEIHRQLCHIYGQIRAWRSTQILQEFDWEVFNYQPPYSPDLAPSVNVFRMTERRRWVSQWFQTQAEDFYDTEYKVCPTVWEMSQFQRWICWKIAVLWKIWFHGEKSLWK